jgi:hypothetical protein
LAGKLSLAGDTVYVGGSFTTIAGKPRSCNAAFSGETGQLYDWSATFYNAYDGSGLGSISSRHVSGADPDRTGNDHPQGNAEAVAGRLTR